MIRKNMKLIVGIVMGLMITSISAYAANSLSANSISIDKSNMSKVENSNLQSALDYLYDKSSKTNIITVESGVKHDYQTYLGIAYLDPTNLDNKCTSANSISTTGTKTGCMKWYIYKDLGDSYKMILDHNTTTQQAWNTKTDESHPYGTNVAFAPNETGDTTYDNLVYKEVKLLSTSAANGGSGWVVETDIISAEEVADIVGYNEFTNINTWFYLDSKNTTRTNWAQGTSNYAWLFDNLGWSDYGCTDYGCNVNNATGYNISAAYWTKTTYGNAGAGSAVWVVSRDGYLGAVRADHAPHGVRPVITVSKNIFN